MNDDRPWPHQRRAPRPDVGGRRKVLPRGRARRHRKGLGQAPARLDGAVDEFQPSHARSLERDRLRLSDGLAGRRPAAVDEDALGPADERALSDRDQRTARRSWYATTPPSSSATSSSASSRSFCASRPGSRWSAALRFTPWWWASPIASGRCARRSQHIVNHPQKDKVWFTRPSAIYDHCAALPKGTMVPPPA